MLGALVDRLRRAAAARARAVRRFGRGSRRLAIAGRACAVPSTSPCCSSSASGRGDGDRRAPLPRRRAAADHDPAVEGRRVEADRPDGAARSRTTSSRPSGAHEGDRLRVWLERGAGQDPPVAIAQLSGRRLPPRAGGRSTGSLPEGCAGLRRADGARVTAAPGYRLNDVASQVGLDFRQGAFRYGVIERPRGDDGRRVCWLDYDGDGWLDLFVVNIYAERRHRRVGPARGGLPRSGSYRNVHGRFVNVSARRAPGCAVRGEGCVAADFNGDGHTDLYVTTAPERRAAVERRQRHVHGGRARRRRGLVRLALRRRGRRRERRRAAGPLRRRLHRAERRDRRRRPPDSRRTTSASATCSS